MTHRDERQIWIGGLPLLEERDMTEDERAAVSARIATWNRARRRWKGLVLGLAPAMLLSAIPFVDGVTLLAILLGSGLGFTALALFAIGPLTLRDLKHKLSEEAEHLRSGRIAAIDITGTADDLFEQATDRLGLETTGELAAPPSSIEVYASTGILATTDRQESDGSRLAIARVAPPSRRTTSAPPRLSLDAGRIVRQRPMSAAERFEIAERVASLSERNRIWPLLGLTLWSGGITAAILFGGRKDSFPLGAVLIYALTALWWYVWLRERVFRQRLQADLAGSQIIVHQFDGDEVPVSFTSLEILPNSRITWSIDGEAAEWRVTG